MSAKEVWDIIKDQVSITEEEFYKMIDNLLQRTRLNEKAAAILVAKKLGVDPTDILTPPLIGRILEIGPEKETRSGVAYRIFSLVNQNEARMCVAFGREHVNRLESLEDKVVKIRRYVLARTTTGEITRITETTIMEELDDSTLPPIYELPPARVVTLAQLKEIRGQRIASAIVIMQQTSQISLCPVCGREVIPSDSEWICNIHGNVEPEIRRVHRLQLADDTGIYQATVLGEIGNIEDKDITFKGMFRGDELYIQKIYKVEEVKI